MNKNKIISIFTVGFISLFLTNFWIIPSLSLGSNITSTLTNHEPINIDGQTSLDNYFSGNTSDGSLGNPYVIENLRIITDNTKPAIFINNTNANILIQNCDVSGNVVLSGHEHGGIYIKGSVNVTIKNCYVHGNTWGIHLKNVNGSSITGNTIVNGGGDGPTGLILDGADPFDNKSAWNRDNMIWLNKIPEVVDHSTANIYDNGTDGNLWGDYITKLASNMPNSTDGIHWDDPYDPWHSGPTGEGAYDRYPFAYLDAPSMLNTTLTYETSTGAVNWTEVNGASGYNVYINGTLNITVTQNSAILNFGSDGEYKVGVRATAGNYMSAASDGTIVTVSIPPPTNPDGIPGYNIYILLISAGISVYIFKKKRLQ